ncbi:hypothetical protein BY996DRAFT_4591477, partial [Phakopsora pachyrhizi]
SLNRDPLANLLKVLDQEQNQLFVDHYIISTANTTSTILTSLLDRMELIELGGYLTEQKLMIAK